MSPTDKANLLNRIVELEGENATLKSELGACQQRVVEIEQPDRLLAATAKATKALVRIENLDEAVNTALQIIGEGWDCDHIRTTENEQIKSAQERAAELAKANIAMRRSIDWLARDPDLNAFLGHLLEEIANQFGVKNAQIFLYDERERTLHTSVGLIDDEITFFPPYTQRFSVDIWLGWDVLLRSPKPRTFNLNTEPHLFLPEYLEFHDRQNHRGVVCTLLRQGEQPLGFIGFACCNRKIFSESELELMQSLAQQATLAIQLTRLAEEAKQAAVAKLKEVIAREQEQAAQERAAELAKANETMRRVLELTARETGINSLVGNVLQAIAEQFDAPIVEWWKVIDDSTVTKQLSYLNGRLYSDEELIGHHGVPEFRVYPETLYFEPMTQRKKHVIGEDCEQLPYPADEIDKIRAWYIANGTRKLLNVPVIVDDKSIGGLVVFLPEDRSFSNSQIEFGWAMSRYIALAVTISTRAEAEKQAAIAREQEQAAQERAEHLARANTALQKTVNALGNIESVEEFIPVVLKIVLENFQATSCAFYEHSSGELIYLRYWLIEGQVLNPTEILALDPDKYALIIQLAEGFTVPDGYLGTPSRQRTRAVQLDHAAGTCVSEFDDFARACGWESELNVPCVIGNAADGALVIYRGAGLPYSEAEIALAETLSAQLALALQASRLAEEAKEAAVAREREQAAQKRAVDLARVNAVLSDSLGRLSQQADPEIFLAQVVGKIIHQMGATNAMVVKIEEDQQQAQLHLFHDGQNPRWGMSGTELALFATPFSPDVTPAFNMSLTALLSENRRSELEGFFVASRYNGSIPIEQFALPGGLEWMASIDASDGAYMVLLAGDHLIGTLHLHFTGGRQLRPEDDALFIALSRQAAIALRLADLATQSRKAAIALEQEKAVQERVAELAKANDIMQRTVNRLAVESSLDGFLGFLVSEIALQLGTDTAVITPYDPCTDRLWIAAVISDGKLDMLDPMTSSLPYPNTRFLKRLLNAEGFCIFDVEEDADLFWPGAVEYLQTRGKRKSVSFVIRIGEDFFGQISLAYETVPNFSLEQTALVQALSTQAALAIQLTRSAEEAKQAAIAREQEKAAQERVTQLAIANNTLKKTLDVLATEPDLDRTLGHILKVTSEQLRSCSSALWLYKPESDRFWLHLVYLDGEVIVATPETAHRLTGQWIYKRDLSRDLALKQHIRDRVPVLYDLDDHPDITKWQRQYLKRLGVRSMLGIPLLLGTDIVGSFTIRFGDRRDFQAEELEFVHALANQATLAIQLLRMAYHKQQAAIVAERNRMARDIHDSLAQSLTGVVMQLNAATEFLTSQPHQAQACITRAQNLAKQGLTEARRSVWLLYQSDPTACNLPSSLTQLSEQMTCGKDISIRMSLDGKPYDLDAPVSLNLLRIAQESLTNALRHAKPQTIHLQLAYTPQQIQLRVQDDGCGFDPHQTVGHGFGLTGMGDRAKVIGAQLQIQSKLGVGTEIVVTVPISSL